jgi:hypothetical protein
MVEFHPLARQGVGNLIAQIWGASRTALLNSERHPNRASFRLRLALIDSDFLASLAPNEQY